MDVTPVDSGPSSRVDAVRRVDARLTGVLLGVLAIKLVHWATGLSGLWLVVLAIVLIGAGAKLGWSIAKAVPPLTGPERKNWMIGWAVLIGMVTLFLLADVSGISK